MRRNKKQAVYFFVLLALITMFLFAFYGKVIIHPNSYIFNSKGDGIKNYYTYAWYTENNKSLTNFDGMNYPYGENFMYTDCHPLLAFLLKILSRIFPGLAEYSIGIMNSLMILSIVLTAIVLYLLFRKLNIHHLLSVLGALGITVLSPQIFRLGGHYALSYSFFIPLTIYLIILYEKNTKRNPILLLLSLSILLFYFTHAYLGMIAVTIVLAYVAVKITGQLFKKNSITISRQILLLVAAVVPVIIFYLFVKLTDTHVGRSANPWGILENHAELSTVFLPVHSPLEKIKNMLFPDIIQNWESWAYIGFFTFVMLLFYIAVSFVSTAKAKKIILNKTWIDSTEIRILFVASLLILAFSMFVPFRFHLERLINYVGFIKQFKTIGRFAWVFYFVSTIMLVYLINTFSKKLFHSKKNVFAYALMVIIPLTLVYEGYGYHKFVSSEIIKSPNLFDIKQTSQTFSNNIKSINTQYYQAILSFPFFYIGSGNFGIEADERIYQLSFLYSYHLKLPLINGVLARSSIPESKKIMQLLASNFYYKNYQKELPNKKPFLLICLNNNINVAENKYVQKATLLSSNDEYSIYEINPEVFFENSAAEKFELFKNNKEHLTEKNGFLVSDTSLYFSFTEFRSNRDDSSFTGNNGCLSGVQRGYHVIFSIEKGLLPLDKKYTARFWMNNDGKNYGQDRLDGWIFFQKRKGENVAWLDPIVKATCSHEINGNWSLVEISFNHTDSEAAYDLVLKGNDIAEATFYIDELLFYDNDLLIYRLDSTKNKSVLFKNNHRIEIPSNNLK